MSKRKPSRRDRQPKPRRGSGGRFAGRAKPKQVPRKTGHAKVAPVPIPSAPVMARPEPVLDSGPFGEGGLNAQQAQFVIEYVSRAGFDGALAAELAGYRCENRNSLAATASRLLRKVKVRRAISLALAKLRDNPEYRRSRLLEIAASSMDHFLDVDDTGKVTLDLVGARDAAALGQIKKYRERSIQTEDGRQVLTREIEVFDPTPAIEKIMKATGELVEKHQVGGIPGADGPRLFFPDGLNLVGTAPPLPPAPETGAGTGEAASPPPGTAPGPGRT